MIVAVIPARGGSKRIPRKNIRPFAGKPIIAYSIAAARACGLFDRIIVSTDDEEIAGVARDCGAETPFRRPPELSDDHTGTDPVTAHALTWLADRGQDAEFACCIYATAPFLQAADLRRGYEALVGTGRNFAFAATTYDFSIQRALRVLPGGGVAPFFPRQIVSRSQDLDAAHHDAGQFYWGRGTAFRACLAMFAAHSIPILLPRHRVQDIDTLEDWTRAELMHAALVATGEIDGPVWTAR
jgi:N-acylneuraminate cytidylyltransferase